MFWRFGGYANVSAIDSILEKSEFTTEELLDESDLIQELKQHNTKLLEYIRKREVLEKLLDYAVAPKLEPVAVPDKKEEDEKGKAPAFSFSRPRASSRATEPGSEEEEAEKRRNKYAFVASEILSSDNWSVIEALMDVQNRDLLHTFWKFLERPSPLDPLQASYFTKVNETLFDKKTEEMISFLKSVDGAVPNMLRHVDSPMVMDLLLKIITLERTDAGHGIVEWLFTKDVMPSLLSFLGPENSWATQTSAGDFMKAIITVSANASQNEQTCIGPNELTRQLVSKPCVEQLIGYMLGGGNALTVGVGIVIEVIRKNNSDYDPDVGAEANSVPSSRDPIYLGTLLRMFAESVPKFMNLIMIGEEKPHFESTFGERIQPLGFDRFKTCELMAELLHCSNMGLLNEVGSEALIAARDAERHRLRAQGSLTAIRGEEAPASGDDLTMRLGSSPPERRLEITNISDDDGFEEVINAAEMREDTSHEFVKAEEEIPQSLPASSFLDKDEDDFVDEPLSSPRLNVSDSKVEEQHFEEPDMVVQPLSPRKLATAELAKTEPSDSSESNPTSHKVTTTIKEIEGMVLGGESGDAQSDGSDVMMTDASSLPIHTPTSSVSETAPGSPKQSVASASDAKPPGASGPLEPQPEDIPAPLFSSSPTKSTADVTAPGPSSTSNEEKPTDVKSDDASRGATATTGTQESGEESIIVGHEVEQTAADNDQIKPVVGDFLKMQFVDYKVVPTILSFFFKYPWNNFLHNVVYDVVQQVFNGPMNRGFNPTLAISLFESADITAQIINGQLTSEQSEAKTKTRMGYMGHLTLIAEEVVKFNERHPPELLSETVLEKVMSPEWSNYVEGPLAETRERDNAILGGVRPDVAMSNRAAAQSSGLAAVGLSSLSANSQGSSALADAGLNGGLDLQENGGSNLSQFAISAGTMGGLSGFGSSSDEEDDDQEDNDDDVATEFRAYTDPLSSSKASGPSLNPPSIPPPPPPPPPLNIPPSRARLQLAARLAMNKRNAASSADGGQENRASGSSGDPSNGSRAAEDDSPNQGLLHQPLHNMSLAERLKDPFADEVEDDEDDDDADSAFANAGDDKGSTSTGGGWNRGNWWRGVVRGGGTSSTTTPNAQKAEKFGDGRDDDDSDLEDDDDEEFGDFAMPEVMDPPVRASDGPAGKFFDREREKVLLKPLPVHPPHGSAAGGSASGGGGSKFGSLWPFDGLGFGGSAEGSKEATGEKKDPGAGVKSTDGAEGSAAKASGPVNGKDQDEPVVVNEDGKRVERTVEAKRRTSIEDPDDDDDDEVVV